ncbi:MAG: small protein [Microbacterium sp.]|jgi:uncharacterized short protein YbdD (DUF466 family)|uniref:YbdD/YjiX family protein n=1 Tax=unclassified Microbacterium TaxID=2609290 RepID=UPI000E768D14|nr:YbdD/YjiX family protein [Microbacterium sp. AG238]MDF2580416.1 small protein [Microbacterium sp.]RKE64457.1 uncharacterized short protein YbdD (DUF466 family) [Microbacterium sp. AG238]
MALAHNSSESAPLGLATAVSAPQRTGSKELCARAGRAVLRVARAVHWYVTSLMGDNAYATYLAHQRRTHPGTPPLTERQFWRERMDDQDRNPGARCC